MNHLPDQNCPHWCTDESDTGEGTVHLDRKSSTAWTIEYGIETHDEADTKRPYVFVEIPRPSKELTPHEARLLAAALIDATEKLEKS